MPLCYSGSIQTVSRQALQLGSQATALPLLQPNGSTKPDRQPTTNQSTNRTSRLHNDYVNARYAFVYTLGAPAAQLHGGQHLQSLSPEPPPT
jgi:hypothetical protein